jgi:tetratricopeptide (TPR) repeat protein
VGDRQSVEKLRPIVTSRWLALAVAACLLLGILAIWGLHAPSNPERILAVAEEALENSQFDRVMSSTRELVRHQDPMLREKARILFEEAAYRRARKSLQKATFSDVFLVEEQVRQAGIDSPRLSNLSLQAQRGMVAECSLEQAGTLFDFGYDLSGVHLRKNANSSGSPLSSEGDTTAKRLYSEYQQLLKSHPEDVGLLLNFGHFCLNFRAFEEAQTAFRKAYEQDPRNPLALVGLGLVEFELGNVAAACSHFEKATAIAPSAFAPRVNLAICYEVLGRHEEAERLWHQLLSTSPDATWQKRIEHYLQLRRLPPGGEGGPG